MFQIIQKVLNYLVSSKDNFEHSRYNEKLSINLFIKLSDKSRPAEIKVVAIGPWTANFDTKLMLKKLNYYSNTYKIIINIIDLTRRLAVVVEPKYDEIFKSWKTESKKLIMKKKTVPQLLIIKLLTNDQSILNLEPSLSDYIKYLSDVHIDINFSISSSKKPKNNDEKSCEIMSNAISDVITYSTNNLFRNNCYRLLNASCTNDAKQKIVQQLTKLTKTESGNSHRTNIKNTNIQSDDVNTPEIYEPNWSFNIEESSQCFNNESPAEAFGLNEIISPSHFDSDNNLQDTLQPFLPSLLYDNNELDQSNSRRTFKHTLTESQNKETNDDFFNIFLISD